jgi:hypothetical protein
MSIFPHSVICLREKEGFSVASWREQLDQDSPGQPEIRERLTTNPGSQESCRLELRQGKTTVECQGQHQDLCYIADRQYC